VKLPDGIQDRRLLGHVLVLERKPLELPDRRVGAQAPECDAQADVEDLSAQRSPAPARSAVRPPPDAPDRHAAWPGGTGIHPDRRIRASPIPRASNASASRARPWAEAVTARLATRLVTSIQSPNSRGDAERVREAPCRPDVVALLPVQLTQVADPNGSRPPVADLSRHLERLLEMLDRADVVAVLCVQAGEVGGDAADATAVAGPVGDGKMPLGCSARLPVPSLLHVHGRNAKLIFGITLHADARSAGIYSRPEARRRALRRPPVVNDVSSNEDRNV